MAKFPFQTNFRCWPSVFGFAVGWPGCVVVILGIIIGALLLYFAASAGWVPISR
jgi:hypothetical protein